jgi:hypothetical protein
MPFFCLVEKTDHLCYIVFFTNLFFKILQRNGAWNEKDARISKMALDFELVGSEPLPLIVIGLVYVDANAKKSICVIYAVATWLNNGIAVTESLYGDDGGG